MLGNITEMHNDSWNATACYTNRYYFVQTHPELIAYFVNIVTSDRYCHEHSPCEDRGKTSH